jgi:predicted amidohydrolase YtcJ
VRQPVSRPVPTACAIDPDLMVVNAKVYTNDGARAEAFAVSQHRFVAVGTTTAVKALAGARTRVIDAGGLTVVPRFIDTHNHAGGMTLLYEVLVGNPFDVEFVSIESIVSKLRLAGAGDSGRYVGVRILSRRYEAHRQAAAHAVRS